MLVLVAGGCTQLNASHCGNQRGDLTCEARDETTPFCDQCEAVNDGCVAARPRAACGASSSSGSDSELTSSTTQPAEVTTASTALATTTESSSSGALPEDCGNGELDLDEACDGAMLPAEGSCAAMGFGEGTPVCADDCTAIDYSSCSEYVECGDGQIGAGEQCDGAVLANQECDDFRGFRGGVLSCTAECTFDTSGCTPCAANGDPCVSGQTVCCDVADMCGGLPTQCCHDVECVG